MKNIISTIVLFAIALSAFFGIDSYFDQRVNVQYVGTVYAQDAFVTKQSLIVLPDGTLSVSVCTKSELENLTRYKKDLCLYTEQIGGGYVMVKDVSPTFKQRVSNAMNHSIMFYSLELSNGVVVE